MEKKKDNSINEAKRSKLYKDMAPKLSVSPPKTNANKVCYLKYFIYAKLIHL